LPQLIPTAQGIPYVHLPISSNSPPIISLPPILAFRIWSSKYLLELFHKVRFLDI
jgi:hypothetical protein